MRLSLFPANFSLSQLTGQKGFIINGQKSFDLLGTDITFLGDINGDGYSDMLLGAYNASRFGRLSNGMVYLIFGRSDWGSFSLDLLSDSDGYWMVGEGDGDTFGRALHTMGDVNADAFPDFLIGAQGASPGGRVNAGAAYGIFSVRKVIGGFLNVSLLNGQNGFKMEGEFKGDAFGGEMGGGEDINGDRYPDFIIGANAYMNALGCSNVYFGNPLMGGSGLVSIPSGAAGFRVNGSLPGDHSGFRVSLYDVNRDGFIDILTTAQGASPLGRAGAGQTYVLPGSSTLGSGGVISLGSFAQEVVYSGEAATDGSGWALGVVNDFNRNGYPEILIGSKSSSAGGKGVNVGRGYMVDGSQNLASIDLATLNYPQGCKINGISSGDYAAYWLDSAGDFDDDGFDDIITGAPQVSTSNPGYAAILFSRAGMCASGEITLSDIDGSNGIIFHGISSGDQTGVRVTRLGDVNGDGINDVAVGAFFASNGGLIHQGAVYIIFGDRSPQIGTNEFKCGQGKLTAFGPQFLNVTDNAPIVVEFSEVTHGQFEFTTAPGTAITTFNYTQLTDVVFRHDDTPFPPAYKVFIPNAGIALPYPPESASVTFFRRPNVTTPPTFSMTQGASLPFTTQLFDVADDFDSTQLIYNVNAQNAQFLLTPPGSVVSQFTRAQMLSGLVFIQQDNSRKTPSFNITVSDPDFTIGPFSSNITLIPTPPVWVNLQLTLGQGDIVNITTANFLVNAPGVNDRDLDIAISSASHGYLRSIPQARSVSAFSMLNVTQGDLQFVTDASPYPPFFQATASDGIFAVGPQSVAVTFNGASLAVVLQNKNLNIAQGQTIILTTNQLSALSSLAPPSQVVFILTNIQHMTFARSGVSITSFSLQDIQQNLISVTQDNTGIAPSCDIQVNDGFSTAASTPMIVVFTPINQPPVLTRNQFTLTQAESQWVTSGNLAATDPDNPAPTLIFNVGGLQGGYFFVNSSSGSPLYSFNQGLVMNSQIGFATYDLRVAPSFTISVTDGLLATLPQAASIQFILGDAPPVIGKNSYTIFQGGSLVITPNQLWITDLDNVSSQLTVTPLNVEYGFFDRVLNPGQPITAFSMEDVVFNFIRVNHDGSHFPLAFNTTVTDGIKTVSQPADVTVIHPPINYGCQLNISQGGEIILGTQNFNGTDLDNPQSLVWTVTNVEYGSFSRNSQPAASFSPADLSQGSVTFTQDGSRNQPSFFCSLSDGQYSTPLEPGIVDFTAINHPPRIIANTLVAQQDKPVLFTPTNLVLEDDQTPLNDLVVNVVGVTHGRFENVNRPGTSIVSFLYAAVAQLTMLAIPNGPQPITYALQVVDAQGLMSNISNATIAFTSAPPEAKGLDTRTIISIVTVVGSGILAIGRHFYNRSKHASSRRHYPVQRILRKELNLEYNDFDTGDGGVFRGKVSDFVSYINSTQHGFIPTLSKEELEVFVALVAQILKHKDLVEPSGCTTGILNWLLCYSAGRSNRLKLTEFGEQYTEIADTAVNKWQQTLPAKRQQLWSPTNRTRGDKVRNYVRSSRSNIYSVSGKSKIEITGSEEGIELVDTAEAKGVGASSPSAQIKSTLWGEGSDRRLSATAPSLQLSSSPDSTRNGEVGEANYGFS